APDSITLDYLDLYGLKPSLERVRASGIPVRVASPRILKPGEEKIAEFLQRLDVPVLVRPVGLVHRWRGSVQELTGDFSLNAANAITARMLLDMGLERLTPGHDLNAQQVVTLAQEAGANRIEPIAWGHMPVFHTEHCVFCRFLSTGTTYKDCGRPCESHVVSVRDESGRDHAVLADTGCRNTVFSGPAQDASLYLDTWLGAGIRHFRLEFAHETPGQLAAVAALFRDALRGRIRGRTLADALRAHSPQGTTQGSLFIPKDYAQLPVLQ
ncbi:MAG TPA: U32 family peptidase, partial [Bryobacteraceae bacterium]|nr:U32 family peptidase [Bryobacteraceae bacterium]